MAKAAVFLTGATGLIGGDLLSRLVTARPSSRIYCLIRPRKNRPVEDRRRALLEWARVSPADAERVVALPGDVSAPDLGLGEKFPAVAEETGEVFHSAASPRFDLELPEARRVNRDSLVSMLAFAREANRSGGLQRFNHLSTAYVVGDPTAPAAAGETPRFRNTYEQSKWEGEQALWKEGATLPVTCYRPSIVVGDSRSGRTTHFRGLYEPMKWVYIGGMTVLPVRPDLKFDAVPVDYVCDAVMALASMPDTIGGIYLLTSGPKNSITVAEYVAQCVKYGRMWQQGVGEPPVHEPEMISREQLPGLPEPKRKEYQELFEAADEVARVYTPYMIYEQLFDDPETREALSGTGIACPRLDTYVEALINYASDHHYGVPR